jgi:hypothetical protein
MIHRNPHQTDPASFRCHLTKTFPIRDRDFRFIEHDNDALLALELHKQNRILEYL